MTIESGLQVLLAKAKHHREESERYGRMVDALREAEKELSKTSRPKTSTDAGKSGRPIDMEVRETIRNAIASLPSHFTLTQLKEAVNGIDVPTFRRIFREMRSNGSVIEKVRAIGVRDGEYEKKQS